MFEILTEEQVKEMTDRELILSEHYYRYNLNEIVNEIYRRSEALESLCPKVSSDIEENRTFSEPENNAGLKEDVLADDKAHERGRKKKPK